MGLFGCARISPVGRFDVCTYDTQIASCYLLLLLLLTSWLYRRSRTVLRSRYLLSKLREHGSFPPAAARTVLIKIEPKLSQGNSRVVDRR